MRPIKPPALLLTLLLLLPVVLLLGLIMGPSSIALTDVWLGLVGSTSVNSQDEIIVSAIRLPRVLLSAFVGANLAVCGAAMQGLFRNPLADPSLIGVSSGAAAGAGFAIVFMPLIAIDFGLSIIAVGAFLGGFLAVILVYRLATTEHGTSVVTMLLAGIAISALAGALNSTFSFIADNDMLRRISFWQMGNLDGANWPRVCVAGVATAVVLAGLLGKGPALNALLLGESEAKHLGINVEKLKTQLIAICALGVGLSVAVAGTIAFVGLLIPHIVRLSIGPDHKFLLPCSALGGAILLICADAIARVIIAPAELPVGILTAALGAPLFFSILIQQRKRLAVA